MKKFDYQFLSENIPGDILNLIALIYAYKERSIIQKNDYKSSFIKLESIAIIQSVKNSNAIEGIITSDERIKAIINKSTKPLNHDEEEIKGYLDALNIIHNNYYNYSLSEEFIKMLHLNLENKAKPSIAGHYKLNDNAIIEIDSYGNRRIRFKPISAKDTPFAMEQLLLAYIEASNQLNINPLLLIPSFILDFLCIHPFSDGNGRMSRLLTLFLLYKEGFDVGKYISFEEKINDKKGRYYEDLRLSSLNWEENNNNYFYFIKNFLLTLLDCYKELEKRFLIVENKKVTKEKRIEEIIKKSSIPISKKEISLLLNDVSITTIEFVLRKLINENKINKVGEGKNTKYIYKY